MTSLSDMVVGGQRILGEQCQEYSFPLPPDVVFAAGVLVGGLMVLLVFLNRHLFVPEKGKYDVPDNQDKGGEV